MRHRSKIIPAVTTVIVAGIALTSVGCGSTSSTSISGAADHGKPIVIGSIASCSGAQAPALGGTCSVLNAWARQTNANGGINGHPVKLYVIDDGGVPARGLEAARQLVGGDHVMAIVGEYSLSDPVWASYIQKAGVPVVGGAATESPFSSNPDFFPSGAQVPTLLYGVINEAKRAGKTKLGVLYCAEAPVCAGLPPIAESLSKLVGGINVVYSNKVAAAAPDFTAVCLAAKQAGVQALYTAANLATVERLRDQCANQGFKPLLLGTVGTTDDVKDPNFEGALDLLSNTPVTDTSTAGGQALTAAIHRYLPGLRTGSQFNNTLTSPWSGGELFAAAAAAAKLSPSSTPADVKRGLYALRGDTLGGIAPPLTFTPGRPTFVRCYFVQQIHRAEMVAEYGAKPVCIPTSDVPAVLKALGG